MSETASNAGRQSPSSSRSLPLGVGPALIGVLALTAFRMLWLGPARYDVDSLLFLPGGLPALTVLLLVSWLVWRRRSQLLPVPPAAEDAAPSRGGRVGPDGTVLGGRLWAGGLGGLLAGVGTGLFAWAVVTARADLMLPSLGALGLAFATAFRGGTGFRAGFLPALVLLLGVRLPKPLEDELVWHLQTWTALWAGRLLELTDRGFVQSGVILRDAEHTFHVIDSCSGLNGIAILSLVALIVRELFASGGLRTWLVVVLAPALAFGLNLLRVAYVASSPDPEALAGIEGDHTLQGLTVLMMGTALLYGLGWLLERRPSGAPQGLEEPEGPRAPGPMELRHDPAGTLRSQPSVLPGRLAVVWLSALALLSWTLPRFADPGWALPATGIDLPQEREGWTSGPAPHDLFFTGAFPRKLHRRYSKSARGSGAPQIVDVLIGYEIPNTPGSTRMMSSKRLIPGPEWRLEERSRERIWLLDREAELSVASRHPGGERAWVYSWRPRDRGLWMESWRAFLALDESPFRRARPRALVQLVAYAPHDGQLAMDRAKQRLDRFVMSFRDELSAL